MANYFNLTLDTLSPSISSFLINNGDAVTTSTSVTLKIVCSDSDVASMKIWGISGATTESAASWETFATTKTVTLPDTAEGSYTIYIKVRDNVYNESSTASDSITLSTSIPTITITGPDVTTISEVSGKNVASFSFKSDVNLSAWKVKLVPATTSINTAGTEIGTTNGSTNMTGTTLNANTLKSCTINGSDLKRVAGGTDGTYIIKVFGQSAINGLWSA